MRIYLNDLKNNIKIDNIPFKKTILYQLLYSEDGIFKIYPNRKIVKLKINDIEVKELIINNINYLCDFSEIEEDYEIFSIPLNYKLLEINKIEYKMSKQCNLNYIEIYNKNKLIDNYFLYENESIDNNLSIKINDFYNL